MKCNLCNEDKSLIAYMIKFNGETRACCSGCWHTKEKHTGRDWVAESLTEAIRQSAKTENVGNIIGLCLEWNDKK